MTLANPLSVLADSVPPRLRHRARDRDARSGVLLIIVAAALFSLWPQLDLAVSAQFYDVEHQGFVGNQWWLVRFLHEAVPWLGRIAAVAGLLVAVIAWHRCGRIGVRWWRRTMLLALVTALGLGFAVNFTLKEHWGRARPGAVQAFGGGARFTPATQITDQCRHNCSFVSGHASTGFLLMALGALGSVTTRRRWLTVGAVAGLVFGLARVTQGGHFASDVVFGGLVMWASTWVLRELWLRACLQRRRRRARAIVVAGLGTTAAA